MPLRETLGFQTLHCIALPKMLPDNHRCGAYALAFLDHSDGQNAFANHRPRVELFAHQHACIVCPAPVLG